MGRFPGSRRGGGGGVAHDPNAVPKSVVDAAADLIVGTAADTVGRLAKGTGLQTLRVNAGATALEWATPATGADRVIYEGWRFEVISQGATDAQVSRWTSGAGQVEANVFRAGSITGIFARVESARTAGTLTLSVFKNGADTGLDAVISATDPDFDVTTQATGLDTVAAGDLIGVRYTTTGDYAPNVNCYLDVAIEITND